LQSSNREPAGARLGRAYNPRAEQERARRRRTSGGITLPTRLKIRVDPDRCQGHSRCKSLAPDLFTLDEYGYAHEVGDGSVPDGLEDQAWLAKSNCPELAIDISDD
jgi:ferredoxin